MNYRPDIDGLRAVAVLSVVLCHAGIAMPGGYVGVDVFFVLSGYLIASLMLKDLQAGTFSLAHFWERRIRRILPALFVVVAASLVTGWFVLVPKVYQLFGRSLVSLMLLRSNDFFSRHTDYCASGVEEAPLLHTWSLSVEEQFYLFIPLLFWGAMRLRRQAWLGPIIGVLAVVSFGCSVYGTTMWSQQAYYALSTRAWEIFAGVLTAVYLRNGLGIAAGVRECAAVLGLAGVVLPCCLYDAATPFPGLAALPPVLGTVVLIVCGGGVGPTTWVHRLLASRPAVGVGLISYSLYLWHWPFVVFLKTHSELLVTMFGRGLFVVASVALACMTYRYVERPFRRGEFLTTRRRLIIATVSVVACLLAAGQMLRSSNGMIDRLPEQAQLFAQTGAENKSCYQLHRAEDVPQRLLRVGAVDVETRLLVWGDSHAAMVLPVIHELCLASGISARGAVSPLRPPVIEHCTQSSSHELAEANAFGAAVVRYAKSSDVDAVLLAGMWSAYFSHPGFADALLQTVDELRAAGRRVYFLKDIPKYDFDVAASLISCEWHGSDIKQLSFSLRDYELQNRLLEAFLPQLVERGVEILDPIPYLRAGAAPGVIPPYDAGGSFYCDANHLSMYGARVIQPVFAPVIDAMVQSVATRAAKNKKPSSPILAADAAMPTSQLR